MLASVFQSRGGGGVVAQSRREGSCTSCWFTAEAGPEPLLWSLLPLRSCFQPPLDPAQGLCLLQASQAVLGQGAQGTC